MTISFCLLLFCSGCTEVIDLGNENGPARLVVFGRLTSGIQGSIIEMSVTSRFNGRQTPVEGATITLVAENGDRENYRPLGEGIYELQNREIIGQPGQEYYVEIDLADGRQYRSIPAIMPEKAATDSLDFEVRTEVYRTRNNQGLYALNIIDFFMHTKIHEPESEPYIRWNMMETWLFPEELKIVDSPDAPPGWCWVTTDLDVQQVLIHDGGELKLNEIPRRSMFQREHDSTFVSFYYLQIVQSSLTADAFRFWKQLDQVSNPPGTVFDQPLGPIIGNLYNVNDPSDIPLGYFEVAHVDTSRVLVDDDDVHFSVGLPCGLNPLAPECKDCLILPNAKKVKPHWID